MPLSGSHMRRMIALEKPLDTRFCASVVKLASQEDGLAAYEARAAWSLENPAVTRGTLRISRALPSLPRTWLTTHGGLPAEPAMELHDEPSR